MSNMAKKEDPHWKLGRPSGEAIVRACLVILGHPPVIPPHVLERIRKKDEAERRRRNAERAKKGSKK